MKASAKDLRLKSKEIINALSRGEEVILTYRGKIKGRIVPLMTPTKGKNRGGYAADALFGIWKDNCKVEDVGAFVEQIRGGRFQ